MTPKFRTNLGVIFMAKLSKQDKIEIYKVTISNFHYFYNLIFYD